MKIQHSSPFLSLLAVLFIGLKLTGYITWSWWWVLSPVWGGAMLVFLIIIVVIALKVLADR